MNKTFKGCLVSIITVILVCTLSIIIIGNYIEKSFQNEKSKVDKSWEKYSQLLRNRNNILVNDTIAKNLRPIISKTYYYLKNNNKRDLLSNEYVLNDSLRKYKFISSLNGELNKSVIYYNVMVKEFNSKYSSFPYNYIRLKKSVKLYDYFEIEYGNDNTQTIKKNNKIDDWINNGGELQ